jgi:hypothetical protein
MKTTNRFLVLIAIVLFLFATSSCESCCKKTKKHTIILNVNTNDITDYTISENSNFGQAKDISNEGFTLHVKFGDQITWEGLAIPPSEGVVKIKKIKYASGTNFFDKEVLVGREKVVANVSNGSKGDVLKYILVFEVNDSIYEIDPKLQMY